MNSRKEIVVAGTIFGGLIALNFCEGSAKIVGLLVFVGAMLYPVAKPGIEILSKHFHRIKVTEN